MPIVESLLEGKTPEGPHLAVLRNSTTGEALAIPQGAMMFLITDPTKPEGTIPMVLLHVSNKSLQFRCACGKPTCTRVLKYQLRVEGFHPRQGNQVPRG